jgi:hypothetical protein
MAATPARPRLTAVPVSTTRVMPLLAPLVELWEETAPSAAGAAPVLGAAVAGLLAAVVVVDDSAENLRRVKLNAAFATEDLRERSEGERRAF